jgi:hypothetical protein
MKSDFLQWKNKSQFLLITLIFTFIISRSAYFFSKSSEWLVDFWLFEDYGYALKIAKNLALGNGETFDGVIPTNGYQPLYVWVIAVVDYLFSLNNSQLIIISLILSILAYLVGICSIYLITKNFSQSNYVAIFTVLIYVINFNFFKNSHNGLETGLALSLFVLSFYLMITFSYSDKKRVLYSNIVFIFAFLARVDFLLLYVLFMIFNIFSENLKNIINFFKSQMFFIISISIYLFYNLIKFDSLFPTSGIVTRSENFTNLFNRFLDSIQYSAYIVINYFLGDPTINGWLPIYNEDYSGYIFTFTLIVALITFAAFEVKAQNKNVYFLSCAILFFPVAYSVGNFLAFERYFIFPATLLLIVFVLICQKIFNLILSKTFKYFLIFLILYFILSNDISRHLKYSMEKIQNPFGSNYYWPRDFGWYKGLQFLNAISQPGDVVAGLQTGNTGFYYKNGRAINLDGVVNMEAFLARKLGSMYTYLRTNRVDYIADQHDFVFLLLDDMNSQIDKNNFLFNLDQVHASKHYWYNIYKLGTSEISHYVKFSGKSYSKVESKKALDGYFSQPIDSNMQYTFMTDESFYIKVPKTSTSGKLILMKDGVQVQIVELTSEIEDFSFKFRVFNSELSEFMILIEDFDSNRTLLDAIIFNHGVNK